jgi:hypothetical protein
MQDGFLLFCGLTGSIVPAAVNRKASNTGRMIMARESLSVGTKTCLTTT